MLLCVWLIINQFVTDLAKAPTSVVGTETDVCLLRKFWMVQQAQFYFFVTYVRRIELSMSLAAILWLSVREVTRNGPLAKYVKLRVGHAPGMPGTFPPPPRISDSDMHHGTCVTHEPLCMPGSLTRGFLWSRWRGKRSQHSRCMRNLQFCVSGKRPFEG